MGSESSENPFIQMNQQYLESTDPSEIEPSLDDNTDNNESSSYGNNNSKFEDLPMEMDSSNLIDAENYSIHDSTLESDELNVENIPDENSLSYPNLLAEKDTEADASQVETSPLIPEWANQTDNPAFFQNLDIPTFLRKLGSNRPRQ